MVRSIKAEGNTVAMTGDGVNDILALKEADCAISVASGSEAARNVSHLVLTDNNFLNLPSVVYEGRRVINNIKSSASLYIMKTLFITILAIFCFAVNSSYFFKTNNMLLFEMLIAALPSAVITLQPNNARVKGKFIPFVLSRSIPGAITLFLSIVTVYLAKLFLPEGEGFVTNFDALLVLTLTLTGLVMLFRVMQPFNLLRALAYTFSAAVCIVVFCVPVLGNLICDGWSEVNFTFAQILYIICIVLAAFPVSDMLIRLCDLMNPSEKTKKLS